MIIRLNEIPENGRDYWFNRQTAELNPVLQDLIQSHPYEIKLFVKPMNTKDFEMTGSVATTAAAQCSLCAEDFDLSLNRQIREILIPNQELDRTGKYAKSTTISAVEDETYSVSHYSKQQYDLGEFIHEAIALEIPFKPLCAKCIKRENDQIFIYDEKMGEEIKPNPFQALKGLKLN
jgi:uncharacterized protein